MSIRVTQSTMYDTLTSQMQKNLAAYMESNEQGSTQKRLTGRRMIRQASIVC